VLLLLLLLGEMTRNSPAEEQSGGISGSSTKYV
jgi:hypothetical protein